VAGFKSDAYAGQPFWVGRGRKTGRLNGGLTRGAGAWSFSILESIAGNRVQRHGRKCRKASRSTKGKEGK